MAKAFHMNRAVKEGSLDLQHSYQASSSREHML